MSEELKNIFEKVLDDADGIIKEVLNLSPEEAAQRASEIEDRVKAMLDKKLEDFTTKEKLSYAFHFKMIAPTLPHAQAWLVDVFIMSVGFLIRDQKVDEFLERIEKLVDYIVDYRESFLPDTEENRESMDDAE